MSQEKDTNKKDVISGWKIEIPKVELKIDTLKKPERGKALIPDEIKAILDKTTKTQLTKKHYKGEENIKDLGLVKIWESKNVEYLVRLIDLVKLKNQTPKVYVSQDKNIKLLLALTEQQQFNKEEKKAEASFTLKEYAKLRGYTDEEIKKGGKFFDELKRDLFSGAYTIYRVPIKIKGKKYILHGAFYSLFEPESQKGKWVVRFNPFYAEAIVRVLKREAKQYYTHYLKEIADRKTTEKPHLHFFYNQLVFRRREGKATIPKKVVNLLKEMGVAEKFLKRPQKCFEILKECLVYIATNYPEELESVYFFNDFNREKEKYLPLSSLKALKDFTYKDFKKLLEAIGIKDIREAFISLCRQKGAEKELPAPKPQDNSELIDQILEWVDRNIDWAKMTTLTREGTEKFLKDCLEYLGFDRLNDLFRQEAQMTYPNAVRFLTKTLPVELKKKQKEWNFKARYRLNSYSNEEIKRFLEDFKVD